MMTHTPTTISGCHNQGGLPRLGKAILTLCKILLGTQTPVTQH